MFNATITVEDNGRFAQIEGVCQNFEAWVTDIVVPVVEEEVAPAILPEAQAEPGPVKVPIMWTSPKQRRFVRMMQKKGLIPVPYVRSHGISQGWAFSVVSVSGQGVIVALGNSAPGFEYAEGSQQQGWMRNTGWLTAGERAPKWGETTVLILSGAINEAWADMKKVPV